MEIERKFLLADPPPRDRLGQPRNIEQLYLPGGDGELRLRRVGARTLMTVKSCGDLERQEWETEVPHWVFDMLAPAALGRILKRRYVVEEANDTLEIDEYAGALDGMWILECEFDSVETARAFRPPGWLGEARDVTSDKEYKNRQLAVAGRPAR